MQMYRALCKNWERKSVCRYRVRTRQSITLKSHIGSDGLLKVHLPDMRDTDIEVVIVYQTSISKGVEAASVSQFYGCIQDDSFIRHPQNEQPEREPLNLIQNHVFFPLSTLSYDESVKCIWRFIRLYNVPPAPRRFWHHVSTTLPNTYSLDFGQKNKFA